MTVRVPVRPELLRWARERSRIAPERFEKRFPRFHAWERAEPHPTYRQLEGFAKATRTPIGFLFLAEPPEQPLPIPDFRTIADRPVGRPSPDLLDTLYLCQERQAWYRDHALKDGEAPLPFVGSTSASDSVEAIAARMRTTLAFDLEERRNLSTWTDALRRFITQANDAGVLVMVSGIVGSNTQRRLDVAEFRGFALVDDVAPLIFLNGADSRAAQMFTLAHELAHIWLGESALSDSDGRAVPEHHIEGSCNRVAAEVLAPLTVVQEEFNPDVPLADEAPRLARRFKVSSLVALRRLRDLGALDAETYWNTYDREVDRLRELEVGRKSSSSGGNFYRTTGARVSPRFARAVIVATLEGRSSFTDAFRLLGFKKMATFRELGRRLGVDV
ncbi:MAG: ImmA/IrrE family metallo-endopeptidase [Rhodospirillales bacterium]|nr:ImmA/IrrE family metallo-endopeptidase [Rhodospirillales bacterium]